MERKIISYIEYLEDMHGLAVSMHYTEKYNRLLCGSENTALRQYNVHKNPYCFYIKKDKKMHRKCLLCQSAVIRRCRGEEGFQGICHAGVREYVSRITVKGEVCGFVSVSGYKDREINMQNEWYDNLTDVEIPVKLLDTVIPPLCMMLSEHLAQLAEKNTSGDVYLKMISYLEEHHINVSLDELCRRFGYSRSYVSHMFKKNCGCTLRHYCNMLKVRDAKLLLDKTDLSITEIAYTAGFNNFSYFINVFRAITGETPLAWRKNRH